MGMQAALQWGLRSFEEAGLANARLEAVRMPLSWSEGETSVEVVQPQALRLQAAASALSPAIPTAIDAELVQARSGAGDRHWRDRARGKMVLVELSEAVSFDSLGVSQRDAIVALREAAEAGALAVLFVSTRQNRLMYRHVNSLTGQLDPIPSAVISREDGLRLLRLLDSAEPVRIRMVMPNRLGSEYETANVVAEIPGAQLPDEIVLVGAHLDSWDMGTGCLDNAVNVALVMHVARSIRAADVSPRRTLRFVLFGGEELGLFGSRSYVNRHRTELDQHVATLVHDMGGGPLVGYSTGGREELLPRIDKLLSEVDGADPFRHTHEAFFVSDNFTFVLQGVPALFAVQDTSGFYSSYHSAADTLDKVAIEDVRESAVVAAALAIGIVDAEERFAKRLPMSEVLAWLRSEGLVRHMRFLGVWEGWRPDVGDSAGRD